MNITEQALLKGLVHVIWADGEVTDDERDLLGSVLVQLGSTPAQVKEVAQMMIDPPDLGDLKSAVPDHGSRLELLRILLAMAHADGKVAGAEMRLLEKMAQQLDVTLAELEAIKCETMETMESSS